jgi:hypothetical protein
MTTPGFAAEVWGVSVIFRSFLSYAVYAVSRGAAGVAGVGGVCVCSSENADGTAVAGVGGMEGTEDPVNGVEALVVDDPKRPNMSSTVERGAAGGGEVEEGVDVVEPKISARRSWFDGTVFVGCPWTGPSVVISSPNRSTYNERVEKNKMECFGTRTSLLDFVEPTGLFSLTA